MTTGSALVAARPSGPPPDPVGAALEGVAVGGGRLFVAMLATHQPAALAAALVEARAALAVAEAGGAALREALAPADDGTVEAELTRLVRAWPQDKRGDLAGYAAELAIFVLEARPSRWALAQACRRLKLRRIHLPAIAEVMEALAAAEGAITAATRELAALPERIARAEAILGRARPAPADSA